MNSKKKDPIYLLLITLIFFVYFFIFRGEIGTYIIGYTDAFRQFIPYLEYLSQTLIKDKTVPFWWHNTGLGYPFVGALQPGAFYPLNYLNLLFSQPLGYNIALLLHFLWLQIATFIYANYLTKKPFISFLASLFFGYSFFNLFSLDIYPMILGLGYYVFNFYLIHRIMDNIDQEKGFLENVKKGLGLIFLISLSLALEFLAGYPQIFVYNVLYIFIYILVYAWKEKRKLLFSLFIFLISLLLIFPIVFIQLLSTFELLPHGYRKMYKETLYNEFSYPPYMLITYIFPYIFGDTEILEYWGPYNEQLYNSIKLHLFNYVSIVTIPLAVFAIYAIFKHRKRNLYPLFFIGLIGLILSLGYYGLMHYMMYFIPIYSDLRAHMRNLFQFNFALSILSSIGFFLFIKILVIKIKNLHSFWTVIYKIFLRNYLYFLVVFLILFLIMEPQSLMALFNSILINRVYILYTLLFLSVYIITFYLLRGSKMIFFIIALIFIAENITFLRIIKLNILERKIDLNLMVNDFKLVKEKAGLKENSLLLITRVKDFDLLSPLNPTNYLPLKTDIKIFNVYDPFLSKKYLNIFNIADAGFKSPFDLIYYLKNPLFPSVYGIDYIAFENGKNENFLEKYLNSQYIVKFKDFKPLKTFSSTSITTPYTIQLKNYYNYHLMFIELEKPKLSKIQKMKKAFYNMPEYLKLIVYHNDGDYYELNQPYLENESNLLIIPFMTFAYNSRIEIVSYSKLRNIKIKRVEIVSSFSDEVISYSGIKPWKLLYQRKGRLQPIYQVWKNEQSLGKIFAVKNIQIAQNLDNFTEKLYKLEFDPFKTAVILKDQLPKIEQYKKLGILKSDIEKTTFSQPIIKDLKFFEKADTIELNASSQEISFLVINSAYFNGWKAYIGNQEIPVLETNGYVSGIILPKGDHHITLKFEPYYKKFFFLPFIFILLYMAIVIKVLIKF